MPDLTAQLIIFLDKSGNFHAELPGHNGARIKVHLGDDFRSRNPEITTALLDKQAELSRTHERIEEQVAAKHNLKSQGEKLAELNAERRARWEAWLETLPRDRREAEITKQQKRDEKAAEFQAARARELWDYTATNHSVELANRVIPDAKRRPKTRRIVYGKTGFRPTALLNPQTTERTARVGNKIRKIDPTLAMDL